MLWSLVFTRSFSKPASQRFSGFQKLKFENIVQNVKHSYLSNPKKYKIGEKCSRINVILRLKQPFTTLTVVAGVSGLGLVKFCVRPNVYCKPAESKDDNPQFDWTKFFELIKPDVLCLIGAIIAILAAAVLNIQLPRLLGDIVNVMTRFMSSVGSQASFSSEMRSPVFKILGLYIAQASATFLYIYLLSGVGERLATRMKVLLYSSILRQDLQFFDKQRTGDLVDCITSDVQEFKSAFKMVFAQGLRSIAQIGGCVVSMYSLSPPMTMGMLVIVSTVIVGGTMLGSLLRVLSRQAQHQSSVVTVISEETISNIRTVRAFANEQLECDRFQDEVEKAQHLYQRLGMGIAAFQAGTNLFLNGVVLASLCMGGYLMATEELQPGALMSFLVATQTIQRSLAQLSLLFGNYVRGMQAGSRVFEYINTEEKIPLSGGKKIPFHSLVADVEFDNVTFSYPTRPQQVILKNFNLKLPAGKTVAIVGTSGNGKSTIAALLERFYDVDEGHIRLAGVDLRELDPSWLRGQTIGLINQEPVLFATSILENIRYGRPSASDSEVYEAARLANADSFILQFPDGYSTILGERGVTVSGGQKQRIAIARALLKDPSILILDEATSALDTESEKVVQQALEVVSRNRTVLVIAHRLSTIEHADIIVVLSGGVIVEIGNHQELIKKRGHYWNLMNQQQSEGRGPA
ncbi:mitochondrial potassium channel ATP-binding subunit-like [Macrosteles quadrilineatus]|uniref:mitochondrial potassium channel ATP-binding subunit-like n=1 Tax=Macrosteles quadrilineatus TaxID=74068 RepID=UPI0023E0D719|nr:mitochondrial potassium channel ATP-binding subunit-like [Macrosteles quadrilineatus]